jgi:hypothetical protein
MPTQGRGVQGIHVGEEVAALVRTARRGESARGEGRCGDPVVGRCEGEMWGGANDGTLSARGRRPWHD